MMLKVVGTELYYYKVFKDYRSYEVVYEELLFDADYS